MRFLVCLFALAASPVAAQPSGVYLSGAFARTSFDADRIERSGETYSAYYTTRLDAAVTLVPGEADLPSGGIVARINVGGFTAGFGYQLGRASGKTVALFENEAGNRVTTQITDHTGWVETTTQIGPVVLGGQVSGVYRQMRLAATSIYEDGTESLGSEYRINGIYTASPTFIEAGIVAGLQVGDRILIPVRVLFPFEMSKTRIPLTDYDTRQLNDTFPRDFERWLADPIGNDTGATLTDRDFVGRRIQVGLEVRLF